MLRDCRDRTRNRLVNVGYIRDGRAFVDDGGVVNIIYRGCIDRSVADIHSIHVLTAHVVGGNINFPRAQGEPPYVATNPHTQAAYEHNQGRRVDRHNVHRTGYPAPTSADTYPATIMKWRITPGCIVYPGPTPGRNPRPVTIVVGRPFRTYPARKPNMAVTGIIPPVAVIIQIFVANDIVR